MAIIFQLIVFLFSAVIHEVAHGYAALFLGDDTAKRMGRLTLNPIKHLDLFGSIIMPLLLYLGSAGSFIFGWAKPVPYNPYNLKHPAKDSALLALAGPGANLFLALLFGLTIRFGSSLLPLNILQALSTIVIINLALALFNLIPIPPLDGSKVLFYFLRNPNLEQTLTRNSWMFLIFIFLLGSKLIAAPLTFLFRLITGL
ncbi:MAG: site-2 protease family protein [Candidatus Parcubacteria bacterium]|jgi:Zn-dependent protease|nr:site-2 protease family protein [Candidatus Parcubacteria bacterium]